MICEAFEERAGGGVVDEDRRSRARDGGDDPLPVIRPSKRGHLAAKVANAVDPKRPPLRLPEAERTIDRPGGKAVVVCYGKRTDRHAMADREQPLPRLDSIPPHGAVGRRGDHLSALIQKGDAVDTLGAPLQLPHKAEIDRRDRAIPAHR